KDCEDLFELTNTENGKRDRRDEIGKGRRGIQAIFVGVTLEILPIRYRLLLPTTLSSSESFLLNFPLLCSKTRPQGLPTIMDTDSILPNCCNVASMKEER